MIASAWFVRSVRMGDTHLGDADWDGRRQVRPACEPSARFTPLNHLPLHDLYYDDQSCADCLATLHRPAHTRRPTLTVAR
ncbi:MULTISPECIES: hypothetical protein [Actinoalloteichus]|uniref:Uncharacterized protein n=1 Tax=Actinoalloteichus fjordicus TaxID=1612552 RepID=A0AAC9PTV2_9PSEU|nr:MULTISPECIES: hypothetical protein [Actinoalloteichus]APU16538.1 hypothetical protein UA74_22600 [Actinoalloteichus fjordicus]APU22606.1 hypothetical protein UA75_23120 [Actinoalloteichus sp. GBA129-24]